MKKLQNYRVEFDTNKNADTSLKWSLSLSLIPVFNGKKFCFVYFRPVLLVRIIEMTNYCKSWNYKHFLLLILKTENLKLITIVHIKRNQRVTKTFFGVYIDILPPKKEAKRLCVCVRHALCVFLDSLPFNACRVEKCFYKCTFLVFTLLIFFKWFGQYFTEIYWAQIRIYLDLILSCLLTKSN